MELSNSSNSMSLILFVSSVVLALVCQARKKRSRVRDFNVVALDLDGTTLNSEHKLTPRTINAIRNVSAKGIKICIATGRSFGAVMDTLQTLNLGVEIPVVCLNGAMCIKVSEDAQTFTRVFDSPVPPSAAQRLLEFAEEQGVVAQYYIDSRVYAAPKTEEHHNLLERYSELTGKKQQIVSNYCDVVSMSAAAKILLMTNHANRLIAEATEVGLDKDFHLIKGSPNPFFVEFLAPGINKGSGLKKMCQMFKLDIEQVIAFGDGENDKEFLEYAGVGVAMNNAKPLAKLSADVINPWSNDEDGVARFLESIF